MVHLNCSQIERVGIVERYILHCDLNSFYASVELLEHPHLCHLPVAVCGNPEKRHGIILAKNEHAKKYGIKTAQTVYSALKLCPQLNLLAPHHEKYSKYSKIVNEIYVRYTDLVEPFGIDESWLDITNSYALFGETPVEVANLIRQSVKNETGLTISVGLSFNKVFAKLGSDYKKPDALTVFMKDDYKMRVWPLAVGELLYVGKAAQSTLLSLGIKNIGQLAAAEPELLFKAMGKMGVEISKYARGLDEAPVEAYNKKQEVKSVGNGFTFSRNLVGESDVKSGIVSLADEVATRLRKNALYATCVQIQLKDTELKSISRQKQLSTPTCLAKDISEAAFELALQNWDMKKPVRMITVTAQNLTNNPQNSQISFFENDSEQEQKGKKRENLERSLDTIRKKYGKHSIQTGGTVKNDIGLKAINTQED